MRDPTRTEGTLLDARFAMEPADEEQPPSDEERVRKKRVLKADRTEAELAAHADAKKKGKSKANADNESIGQAAAVDKVLAGKAHELSSKDKEAANTYLKRKAEQLRAKVFEFAHDTGSSVVLVVKPNDAFGMQRNENGTFPAAYVNSFMAAERGPSLDSEAVDTLREHIFDHVHELPDTSRLGFDDKELLKVADRLGCNKHAQEQLDKARAEGERARKASGPSRPPTRLISNNTLSLDRRRAGLQ